MPTITRTPTLEDLVKLASKKAAFLNPRSQTVQLYNSTGDYFYNSSGYYYPTNVFVFRNKQTNCCVRLLSLVLTTYFRGSGALSPWDEPLPHPEQEIDYGYFVDSKKRLYKRISLNTVVPSSYNAMQEYCRRNKKYTDKVIKKLKNP